MNQNKMTKNFVFREFECGLSVEDTAKLCFKNASEIKEWDAGKKIPPECKRLMRWYKRRELYHGEEWNGFKMEGGRLITPNGEKLTPQQLLAAIAILQIEAQNDAVTRSKLIKYARAIAKIKSGT